MGYFSSAQLTHFCTGPGTLKFNVNVVLSAHTHTLYYTDTHIHTQVDTALLTFTKSSFAVKLPLNQEDALIRFLINQCLLYRWCKSHSNA